jgi:XTP/dITP diphosphohydrolase
MDIVSFITSNPHKFNEIKEIFKSNGLELNWINRRLPEIQANNLEDVVEYSLSTYDLEDVFIEDTGFFIEALKGFPGVYSRYVFDTIGNQGILSLISDKVNRRARFIAVIGVRGDMGEDVKLFKGEVKGSVSLTIRGSQGFGYDPIFIPEGFKNTFGEDKLLKARLSHRKKAAEKLIEYLKRK